MVSQWQRFWSRVLRVSPFAVRSLLHGRFRRWERATSLAIVPFEARLMPASASAATVSLITDKSAYSPGENVYLNAQGFQAGETVQFQVQHTDGLSNTPGNYQPWQ